MKYIIIIAIVVTIGIMFVAIGSTQAFALEWKDSTGNIPRQFKYGYSENDAYRYCTAATFSGTGSDEYTIWCKEFKDYWKKKNTPQPPYTGKYWKDSSGYAPESAKTSDELSVFQHCDFIKKIDQISPDPKSKDMKFCKEFDTYYKKINKNADQSLEMIGTSSTKAVTGSLKIYINSKTLHAMGPLDRYGSTPFNVKCNDSNDVAISAGWEAPEGVFASVKKPVGTNSYDFKLIDMYKTSGKATLYVTCMQVD